MPPEIARQLDFDIVCGTQIRPFKTQLLKWIGNKQRFAHEIASHFPKDFDTYFEPFLGSGAVLGCLRPRKAVGSDTFKQLAEIWKTLACDSETLIEWYRERHDLYTRPGDDTGYYSIRDSYNRAPNPADLLFLCRSCYGGVVRFRKSDGGISTPCGVHTPISPDSFAERVEIWKLRTAGAVFEHSDFSDVMATAKRGDLIYCDPPYTDSQAILYGGQAFSLHRLFASIEECKRRGVRVALSIDGMKKSEAVVCRNDAPKGLFEQELFVNCGRSMLRRFQREGETLEDDVVHDRLLLTY